MELEENQVEHYRLMNSLAKFSCWQLYKINEFYGFIKKWIINSPNYTGDGHYLINARPLIYTLTDDEVERLGYDGGEDIGAYEEWYCFDSSSRESEKYYPSIDIPEEELSDGIFGRCIKVDKSFTLGISMKSNVPVKLIYHGNGFINDDLEATRFGQFPKHIHDAVQEAFDITRPILGNLGMMWYTVAEDVSNDTWTFTIPSFAIDLPSEDSWIVQWALPELISEVEILQKEIDSPDRKDLNDWKEQVKERDQVCIVCGDVKHLECHHVFPFGLYPELRDEVSNGVVLCRWCHRRYHSHYGKGENVNPSTLMQFVQRFGTGATQSHVTTVEHVEQVLKGDAHMSKKEKLEQIIEIIKGYNQDDQPCTIVELFKDSNITMLKLEELLDALAVKGVVYQFPEGQYHVA